MSNQPDNLDNKLSNAKTTADRLLQQHKRKKPTVEKVKTATPRDYVLWFIAVVAIAGAVFTNTKLQGIWEPASDVWVRLGIIIALVIFSLVCLAFTNQGSAFKVLVKDSGTELRRVTWPTKLETIHWTWQVIAAIAVFGALIWFLDMIFNQVVGFFIG